MPRPFVPTLELRAVLAAVKAWPGNGAARGIRAATASLDRGCARRSGTIAVGTKKPPSVEQRNSPCNPAAQGVRGNVLTLPLDLYLLTFPAPYKGGQRRP